MLDQCLVGKIIQCNIDHSDPESFVVGRLVSLDHNWILMQDLSPAGRWNGLALYMQSDIGSVDEDTDYLHRIVSLVNFRNEPEPVIPHMDADPLANLLLYARASNRVVGLELYASGYRDINGTIDSVTRTTLCINQVDEYGRADGKSYLSVDAITRCFLDDEESKCLEILRNGL